MTEREFQKQLRNYRKTQIMPVELAVKLLTECGLECVYEEETRDALDMAVMALEQEPDAIHNEREQAYMKGYEDASKKYRQEPCEDAISRQAVDTLVDELARAISDERCCMSRGRSTATIMQDILDLPSVTPKQRVGYWIFPNPSTKMICECSLCGGNGRAFGKDNYCPNCGAKMGSEDKECI